MKRRGASVALALAATALAASMLCTGLSAEASAPDVGTTGSGQAVVAARAARAAAMPAPGQAENEFIADINQLRQSQGLNALIVDPALTSEARIWASTMNDAGKIFHSQNLASGISANWSKLGENVGVGGEVQLLFDAFVNSPAHYENLVDPAYTYVGVGVVMSGDGSRMFTAHRFMGVMDSVPAAAPPPPAPAPAPAPAPVATTTTVAPAPATTALPTTTIAPTTIPPEPPHKFGRLDGIAALIDRP